jgi:transposase
MIIGCNLDVIPEQMRPLVVNLHNQNVELREENRRLRRELYAAKSERHLGEAIEPNGSMFNEAEDLLVAEPESESPQNPDAAPTKPPRKRSPDSGGRAPLPDHLPRTRIEVDVPADEKICPHDGSELVHIGERVVETLAVKPAEFSVIQHVYPTYGCPTCKKHMAQAPAVPAALPQAACDPSLIAYILEQKFNWGMPLYRLEQQFEQLKVDVSRTSMARWVINAADALGDVAFEIKQFILSQPVIHADETTVQVLKGTGKKPTSKSYMCGMCTPRGATPAVWFEYSSSRDKASAASLLRGFKGHLHLDGYEGYSETIAKNGITRVGCWAHVRRYFDIAKKDGAAAGKPLSSQFLDDIQALFLLEREWASLSPEERRQGREERSKPLVETIRTRLDEERYKVTPKSKLGEAMTYLANQWDTLIVFLDDGRVAMSNNQMENHIRPFTVGRKNWLFSDTVAGAEASALLYTLVGTARANGLAVGTYLEWLLQEIPKAEAQPREGKLDLTPFLPWNYKAQFAKG